MRTFIGWLVTATKAKLGFSDWQVQFPVIQIKSPSAIANGLFAHSSQLKALLIPVQIRFKRTFLLYTQIISLGRRQLLQFNTDFGEV